VRLLSILLEDCARRERHATPPSHERIDRRDKDDWPVLAATLALDCPIRTEDTNFFDCGVATWTTDRVELYLAKATERGQ
jgi:predicted nucleic acid-binding protein